MPTSVRDRDVVRPLGHIGAIAALAAALTGIGAWLTTAHGAPPAPDDIKPPEITLDAERGEIAIEGDLAEGTAKRLRVMLRARPNVRVLSLDSDGGLVDEAEQLGDIVAAHGLSTVVRDSCVSACTLVYVRGRERFAQEGARFGFHAPWVPAEGGKEEQVPSDDEKQAYLAAGIAGDFVTEALAVPSAQVWFPDGKRLVDARVVTAILPEKALDARLATLGAPNRYAAAPE